MYTQKMSNHVLMLNSNDLRGTNYSSYIESVRALVLVSGIKKEQLFSQTQEGIFEECIGGHETIFPYSWRVPKKSITL